MLPAYIERCFVRMFRATGDVLVLNNAPNAYVYKGENKRKMRTQYNRVKLSSEINKSLLEYLYFYCINMHKYFLLLLYVPQVYSYFAFYVFKLPQIFCAK